MSPKRLSTTFRVRTGPAQGMQEKPAKQVFLSCIGLQSFLAHYGQYMWSAVLGQQFFQIHFLRG